jgi:hypothetical protein
MHNIYRNLNSMWPLCCAPYPCGARQRLGPSCQPVTVGTEHRRVASRWARLCRAPAPRGARQRLVGPMSASHCGCRAPSLPCTKHVRHTTKVGAHMPVRHCGRRPTAGGWQVGRPCRAPAPCGARQRLGWAPWLAGGPIFAVRQTPRRTATIVGPVGSALCRAPRPEAHGKDRDEVNPTSPAVSSPDAPTHPTRSAAAVAPPTRSRDYRYKKLNLLEEASIYTK